MNGARGHHPNRQRPVGAVWAVLSAAPLVGFVLAEGAAGARIAATAAILLAAIKVNLVAEQYMDLRWHHRPLRLLMALWLTVVTAILLAGYWLT